jgi:hypothetical protein
MSPLKGRSVRCEMWAYWAPETPGTPPTHSGVHWAPAPAANRHGDNREALNALRTELLLAMAYPF